MVLDSSKSFRSTPPMDDEVGTSRKWLRLDKCQFSNLIKSIRNWLTFPRITMQLASQRMDRFAGEALYYTHAYSHPDPSSPTPLATKRKPSSLQSCKDRSMRA